MMGMPQINQEVMPEQTVPNSSDDRYKTLFERINAAAFLTSFEGQIQEANQKSYEYLGYDWNELLRLTLQDVLSKDLDWTQLREDLAARGCLSLESETICKNGTQFPVDVNISIFRMNGKLVLFVLLWDITERKNQEKRLKESEKKYHGLFEYTTDGIFVLDARGDILDINTRMCEILDVKKSSVLNKNLFSMDLLTARSQPVVIQQFEQLLSEKIAGNYTTEIKNRQGKILEVEISSFFLVKKDNEVDNFVLIVRDITARNEAEQQRLEEHALLQTLLEHMPFMVTFKDDQHRFLKVSRVYADTIHMSPEQMIGKTDFDFFPSEVAQRIVDDENAIMRSGQAIVDRVDKMVAEDGSERWLSVTRLPRYDEEGTIIGTLGLTKDITIWKELEGENGQALSLIQALLDGTNDPVSVKDTQHRFVYVNKALAMSLRVTPESMIGKTDFDYMPKEQAQKAFEQETQILQTGSSVLDSVEMIIDSTGNQRWISVTKIPWFNREGKILGTLCYSRDVTDSRKI